MPEGRLQRTRRNQPELVNEPMATSIRIGKRQQPYGDAFKARQEEKAARVNGDVCEPTAETPWGV